MRAQDPRSAAPAEHRATQVRADAGLLAPERPTAFDAGATTPAEVLALQRSLGNASVSRLLDRQPQVQRQAAEQQPHVHSGGCGHGAPQVQRRLAGAMENLTRERLQTLLPSYGVIEPEKIEAVLAKYDSLSQHNSLELRSIPQLLEATNRREYPRAGVEGRIKERLSTLAGSSPHTTQQTVTLHRGTPATRRPSGRQAGCSAGVWCRPSTRGC
ncbi:hypothetical protein GXW82_20900 [Streptacidiphilus sp. 4-A2]|nr:hypothetical protein [Streptacidiphilus sp. 4-A2]